MIRGYRGIIVAVAGLVLIGASPSKQGEAQSQNAQPAEAVAEQIATASSAVPEQPIAPRPDEGCKRGQDDRQSDLCAQWKAADAAFDGSRWSFWQLVFTGVGLILGAITMAAAIAAAMYAKRAAIATEDTVEIARKTASEAGDALAIAARNADAAASHVEIAKDSAERELRAYLSPENIKVTDFAAGLKPCFQFSPMNSGKTPAYDVISSLVLMWMTNQSPHDAKVYFRKSVNEEPGSRSVISPRQISTIDLGGVMPLGTKDVEAVKSGTMTFLFAGIISYRDTFGKRHLSIFKTFLRPELLEEDGSAILSCCRKGNASN